MTPAEIMQEVTSAEYLHDLEERMFKLVCYGAKNGAYSLSAPEVRALEDALDVISRLNNDKK